ncbi:MAG: hypothetical protein ABII74_07615 [Elusimicrobiota bacterium]
MLPHNHFLIAGLVIAPVGLLDHKTISQVIQLALVGGFASSALDLDVYISVLLKSRQESRLKKFTNPLTIYRQFDLFMDTLMETGIWKTGLWTHPFLSIAIILLTYIYWPAFYLPVALGLISHLISDVPNLKRILKIRGGRNK